MDSLGTDGQGHVAAPVHQDAHRSAPIRRRGSSGPGDRFRQREQGGALEVAFPDLNPVDPGTHGGSDRLGQSPRRGRAIGDQAQDGVGTDQKLASPSAELEADA